PIPHNPTVLFSLGGIEQRARVGKACRYVGEPLPNSLDPEVLLTVVKDTSLRCKRCESAFCVVAILRFEVPTNDIWDHRGRVLRHAPRMPDQERVGERRSAGI